MTIEDVNEERLMAIDLGMIKLQPWELNGQQQHHVEKALSTAFSAGFSAAQAPKPQ